VLIEAAAAGRPIVTTPIRNAEDVVIPGESGFVVEATPEAIAERIGFLLDHSADAAAMGRRGQEYAFRRYNPDRTFADLVRMWETTARRRAMPVAP
jgi:glycosyltransferase involved in cell wall biosynthesis